MGIISMVHTKVGEKLTSGEAPPAGLSCAMSGRAGTKLSVTALPTHFMPLAKGRAPSIWALGHPMTQRPSTKAWVESDPSLPLRHVRNDVETVYTRQHSIFDPPWKSTIQRSYDPQNKKNKNTRVVLTKARPRFRRRTLGPWRKSEA